MGFLNFERLATSQEKFLFRILVSQNHACAGIFITTVQGN